MMNAAVEPDDPAMQKPIFLDSDLLHFSSIVSFL